MRGEFKFESQTPEAAATAYARALGDLLHEARPLELEVDGSRVLVRGGIFRFVSRWNLLVGVTSATIDAVPTHGEVLIRYDIRVTETVVVCVFATFLFTAFSLIFGHPYAAPVAAASVWGWLFGMNYLIVWSRMRSAFRRVAKKIAASDSSTLAKRAG